MEYKAAITHIEDVDEKGQVVIYPAVLNVKDLGQDTIHKGAFTKTIQENFQNIQHYKNHNPDIMPGVIKELSETDKYLRTVSNLILKTQDGLETYEQYKAMAAAGKSMKHSIGYNTIKQMNDPNGGRFLKEIALGEISTLTRFPMNPAAITESVKSLSEINFEELLIEQKYFQLLLNCKFTDAKLEDIEKFKNHIDSLLMSRKQSTQVIEPRLINGSDYIKNINFNL